VTVGRLLNNIGGLTHMLGKPEEAVGYLKGSLRILLDEGSDIEAAHVVCSLAEINLETGRWEEAESEARKALELLGDRVDYLSEIGTAQLALGRSLLKQDRLDEAQDILGAADRSFEQLASVSHRASAWIALGDLAQRRDDDREAARLYRRAAEALQDVRFQQLPRRGRQGGVATSQARIVFILTTVVLVAGPLAFVRPLCMFDG